MDQIFVICFLLPQLTVTLSWDPDAGIIQSYTKTDHVTVTASSNQDTAVRIIDSDDNTNWVSDNCLPSGYMKRGDVNLLLDICQSDKCSTSDPQQDLSHATDGSTYTTVHVTQGSLTITLRQPSDLSILSVSGFYNHGNVSLYGYSTSGQKILIREFQNADNYKTINIPDINVTIAELEFDGGNGGFGIKEVSAIGPEGCVETVRIDLGSLQRVGTVRTRHWAGTNNAHRLDLSLSKDGLNWINVKSLDPNALRAVITTFEAVNARYITLTYYLTMTNYKHVYCYEVDAWDEHGLWGPALKVKGQTQTIREILGVNGIWGWGHTMYSSSLAPGEGPQLYNRVASHARNYHNLNWDVTDPDNDPQFPNMAAGKGTQAMGWLNWDTEYLAWRNANLSIDVSVQFTNKSFPQSVWDTPEQSAFQYGREFAKHFGPVNGNGYVWAMEVGNEPWDYEAGFYATVLKGMAAGVRSVDSKLIVIPGTFQAENKHEANTYIGTRILPEVADNIDVINCHTYSFVTNSHGIRIGTYPEHKESTFNNIKPIARWRDSNTPTKSIWVTEWGWDADGGGEDCAGTECVTERAQAVYGIRGLMILSRSGVERATWFFYANDKDCNTLFCRSGLTTSKNHNFSLKTVFMVFEDLLCRIGDAYFHGVLQENDSGYVYLFGNRPSSTQTFGVPDLVGVTHIVGWLPVDISNGTVSTVDIRLPAGTYPDKGWRYTGIGGGHHVVTLTQFDFSDGVLKASLSGEPRVIELRHTDAVVGK